MTGPGDGESARAFALLEHTTASGVHWDLLIEIAGQERLATWRLAECPLTATSGVIAATALPPHRRAYLEYQGPISGDRGSVRRIAGGTLAVAHGFSAQGGRFDVTGPGWRGKYKIDAGALTRLDPGVYDAGLPNRTED